MTPGKNPNTVILGKKDPTQSSVDNTSPKTSIYSGTKVQQDIAPTVEFPFTSVSELSYAPDKDCPLCQESGRLKIEGGTTECDCILRKRTWKYLGDNYARATWDKTLDIKEYVGRNILFQKMFPSAFRHIVKSYLILNGNKIAHKSCSAYDVFTCSFRNSETHDWDKLLCLDLVILYLVADQPNKTYGLLLQSLIEARMANGKLTWVYTDAGIDSPNFRFLYSFNFAEYLESRFVKKP